MATRKHDRNHFFKYTSIETALEIIRSKSFRWSSPIKFNDPFDHQTGFNIDVEPNEFAKLLTQSIERIIFSDINIDPKSQSLFTLLTLQLRRIRDRLPHDEIIKQIHTSSLDTAANLKSAINRFNNEIIEQLCHSRVFCVSELNDNVVMWSHYANEHKGVVFKLLCIDEIDNTLLAARKVIYTNNLITFLSAGEYAKHLTGEKRADIASLCWNIAFTKHIDWSYEREWRVHIALLDDQAGSGYTIYAENPRIFESICLGCRMPENEISQIVEMIKQNLPKTKIYRVEKSLAAFSLSFREID